ncbi:14115_t:CDS:2, partial [Gigaspora rosea]
VMKPKLNNTSPNALFKMNNQVWSRYMEFDDIRLNDEQLKIKSAFLAADEAIKTLPIKSSEKLDSMFIDIQKFENDLAEPDKFDDDLIISMN